VAHTKVTKRRFRALLISDALRWTSGDVRVPKIEPSAPPTRRTPRTPSSWVGSIDAYLGGYAEYPVFTLPRRRCPLSSDGDDDTNI